MRSFLSFATVLSLGFGLEARLEPAFSSGFVALASASIGKLRFGRGGHADFEPRRARQATRDAADSWDASVELSIDGVETRHRVAVNPRRLAYLPCLFFLACIATAPLRPARKLACVLLGLALLAITALASLWIIAAWLFARVPGLVYDLSPSQRVLLELGYEGFVTPIGNKFVVPLALVLLLVALLAAPGSSSREAGRA